MSGIFELKVPRIFIAGVSSACQAEHIALALLMLLKKQGLSVSVALYGGHLNLASIFSAYAGRYVPCVEPELNDFDQTIRDLYLSSIGSQIQIICSPYGFFDSPSMGSFSPSAAELAIRTSTPTILCIDEAGYGNGIVPQIKGFKSFATGLNLAGIANLMTQESYCSLSPRSKANDFKNLIEEYFPNLLQIHIDSRDLPFQELPLLIRHSNSDLGTIGKYIQGLTSGIASQVEPAQLFEIAKESPSIEIESFTAPPQKSITRIAVALDSAFTLLYQNNLLLLRYLGAEIVTFSPLSDRKIPDKCSLVYLPGLLIGEYWRALVMNQNFFESVENFLETGGGLLVEGSASTLFSKNITEKNPARESLFNSKHEVEIALNHSNQPSFRLEMELAQDCLIGEEGMPIGMNLSGDLSNSARSKTQLLKKLSETEGVESLLFREQRNNFLITNGYLNFSSNPLIALKMINLATSLDQERGKL